MYGNSMLRRLIAASLLAALAVAALVVALPSVSPALAEDGDFKFIYYDDGTAVLQHYYGSDEVVTIPAEHNGHRVVTIAPLAFHNGETGSEDVKKLVIEPGIEEIAEYSFENCRGLVEVEIPGTVHTIGNSAFSGCHNLRRVALSEGLRRIEAEAFSNCYALEAITIPDSVCYLGENAFYLTDSLADIQVGSQYLGRCVFQLRGAAGGMRADL